MAIYTLLFFAHVSGVLGFFATLMLWVTLLVAMRRTRRIEDIRLLVGVLLRSQMVVVISILILVTAGVAMAILAWGFSPGWIQVALGRLVLIAPLSRFVIEPRLRAIAALAATTPDGPLPPRLTLRVRSPWLSTLVYGLVPMLLGMVFMMVVKPDRIGALLIMAGVLVLDMLICIPFWAKRGQVSR